AHRARDDDRALALPQVVSRWLPGDGRVAEDAEQVVAELERLPEREPEPAAGVELVVVRSGEGCAQHDRVLDGVSRRLRPYDLAGSGLVRDRVDAPRQGLC